MEREKQYIGKISYEPLWELLKDSGKNKRWLREEKGIHPTVINRLTKNQNVAVDTIMYLCEIFDCQPENILRYVKPEEDNTTEQ